MLGYKMFDSLQDMKISYDANTKIWSGPKVENFYDKDGSVGLRIFEQLRKHPKKICQISDSEDTQLTNEEVLLYAIRISLYLKSEGIEQSDVIGLSGYNTTYMLPVVLACFFNGSPYHATNPNHDQKTTKLIFEITKPKIIFCGGDDYAKIKMATNNFQTKILTLNNHQEGIPNVLDLIKPANGESLFEPVELKYGSNQTMAILNTSGSTGLPKAVCMSNITRLLSYAAFPSAENVVLCASSLDWGTALCNLLVCVIFGSLRIITAKPLTPEYFLKLVGKYEITHFLMSPMMLASLAYCNDISIEKLKSLRYITLGGGKCLVKTIKKLQSYLVNGKIAIFYGFTEFERGVSLNYDSLEKPNSVGLIRPGVQVRIINESGDNLGHGEIGEICCYNGVHWNGYYGNPVATKQLRDKEGWFHSGDMGYFDEENYLYVVGRKKDMLKYLRMQYSPTEIEGVIAQNPDVVDVCVFGVWGEMYGDAAAAAVVKRVGSCLTAEDVVEYVRQNIEANYKHLNAGAIIIEELPKTLNGKIDREKVKNIFLASSGINA